jgi:hypothetical protein
MIFLELFGPALIIPLLWALPWVASSCFFLAATLRVLGGLKFLGERSLFHFPPSTQFRLLARTAEEERRYVLWCIATPTALGFVLLASYALGERFETVRWVGVTSLAAVLVGCVYAPWYHDRSELLGDRAWPLLRRSPLWTPFRYYFDFRPMYLYRPVPGLPSRDSQRRQLMEGVDDASPPRSMADIEHEMNVIDGLALLKARFEPFSWFTFNRERYLAQVYGRDDGNDNNNKHSESPPPRRPHLYACHPHGLSALTAVFGVVMYGTEPMLPDPDNVRIAVADILFTIPIIREWVLACGCISASAEAIAHQLLRQRDVFLTPGGMLEQAMAEYGKSEIIWTRTGFCTLAFHYSALLVPVYAIGENSAYSVLNVFPRFRIGNYRRFGYAFPWAFLGPFPARITPVIGVPLDPLRIYESDASHDRAHRYFNERLRRTAPRPPPPPTDSPNLRFEDDTDDEDDERGDTPLVELGRVALDIVDRKLLDTDRPLDDYYGTGYADERTVDRLLYSHGSSWFIHYDPWASRREEDGPKGNAAPASIMETDQQSRLALVQDLDDIDTDELSHNQFVTIFDRPLDDADDVARRSQIADIQRAFYAQFVDLCDTAKVALCGEVLAHREGRDMEVERWGDTFLELRHRLHRDSPSRKVADLWTGSQAPPPP